MSVPEQVAEAEVEIRVCGDVALMTSRNEMRASFDGKEWNAELYLADVWLRRDGQWRIGRHASRVVPGAG
jgi:ketosteroid isomerase-like protein